MKPSYLLLMMLCLAVVARADDQIQSVQQALKDQGFYYGTVDGQEGAETDAAIRRYQIRQGLDVTGKLNAQTLSSLNISGSSKSDSNTLEAVQPPADESSNADAEPTSKAAPPKSVVQSDKDFLRKQPPQQPPADDSTVVPDQPSGPPDQADAGQTAPAEYARFFRKTPYESAPPVVQRSTVQQAQMRMAKEGFYRGIADGELGDSLSRALVAYQRDADLAPTGRLDMDTLSDMNLLPKRHVVIRPPVPYGYDDPAAGRPVYRGIWVH